MDIMRILEVVFAVLFTIVGGLIYIVVSALPYIIFGGIFFLAFYAVGKKYLQKNIFNSSKVTSEDKDLADIYNNQIKEKFAVVEEKRKKLIKKMKWLVTMPVILAFGVWTWVVVTYISNLGFLAAFIMGGMGYLLIIGIAKESKKKLSQGLKKEIKEKLVEVILTKNNMENINYKPDKYLPLESFDDSNLYNLDLLDNDNKSDMLGKDRDDKIVSYRGEDLITGDIDGINFQFSDLAVEKETYVRDDGHWKKKTKDLFSGAFLEIDFNKQIQGNVIIERDVAEQLFGYWGSKMQFTRRKGYEIVKLENIDFEKLFKVTAQSSQNARYVLNPAFMERMMKLNQDLSNIILKTQQETDMAFIGDMKKDKYNAKDFPISYSFKGNKLYIAFPMFELFYVDVKKKYGVDINTIKNYISFFKLVEEVIKDLRLNQDIWIS